MIADLEILAARAVTRLQAGDLPTDAELAALAETERLRANRNCMPQVHALLAAGWTIEWPEGDTEPWAWAFRAPPKRAGRPGRRWASLGQAYGAMVREKGEPTDEHRN